MRGCGLQIFAQDDSLTGTWETSFTEPEVGDVTIRLTFEEDGGFQLDQVISASDNFLAEAGDAIPPLRNSPLAAPAPAGSRGTVFLPT